jgi:pimeloyl-ACP methyl ester carboxylesterase
MRHALTLSLTAFVFLSVGSGWLMFYPPVPADLDGARNLDAEAERVRIPVAESDSLDGWLLRGTAPGVIVLFHGYGRKHDRVWRYAQFLEHDGWTMLTVDFRSSRGSNRLPTTLGHHELEDAEAVWTWMRHQPWGRRQPAGVLGESLGGSVALLLAARHDDVLAVVADCPFASGERVLEDTFRRKAGLPPWPAVPIARALGRAVTGYDPGEVDVIAAARELTDRPLYFIHATKDDRMAAGQARDLWKAAGAKDPIWLVDTGHNEAWQREREAYEAHIAAFFEAHLRSDLHDATLGPAAMVEAP